MFGLLLALAVHLDAVSEGMYANQVAELGAIGIPFSSVSRLSGMARSQMPLNAKRKRIGAGLRLCRDSENVVN